MTSPDAPGNTGPDRRAFLDSVVMDGDLDPARLEQSIDHLGGSIDDPSFTTMISIGSETARTARQHARWFPPRLNAAMMTDRRRRSGVTDTTR